MSRGMLTGAKRNLRASIEVQIAAMSASERAAADRAIAERLVNHPTWLESEAVLLYDALPNEVATREPIRRALASGKKLYLPRIDGRRIGFHRVENDGALEAYARHRYGMHEPPTEAERWDPSGLRDHPTIVVCPGRVYDVEGGRLGHGSGFYDRFFRSVFPLDPAHLQLHVVGICYEVQIVRQVPTHEHDHPIDFVVTERRMVPGRIEPAGAKE